LKSAAHQNFLISIHLLQDLTICNYIFLQFRHLDVRIEQRHPRKWFFRSRRQTDTKRLMTFHFVKMQQKATPY
jgi:hypothetical protein